MLPPMPATIPTMTLATPTWRGESHVLEQTLDVGRAVAQHLRAGDLIALVGELGAGKTQFVRGLADGLGIGKNNVASPTFVMVQEYVAPLPSREGQGDGRAGEVEEEGDRGESKRSALTPALSHPLAGERGPDPLRLIHIDAYRIQKLEELESIGWEITSDLSAGELREDSVIAIEWADRLAELVGSDRLEVKLQHLSEGRRAVTVTPHGSWIARFEALRADLDQTVKLIDLTGAKPQTATAPCPICGKPVTKEDETFPFCSKRCRTIDLGKWLGGDYMISRKIEESDLDEE